MIKHDVVYILKNNYDSEELRYSLRSVVQNFPYRKIVFVGGCPKGITPDIYIPDNQEGSTKWARTMHSLQLALDNDELTEEIYLFNDDFFIMDRVTEDINWFNGTLEKRIIDLKKNNPNSSAYIRNLEIMKDKLFLKGKDTLSFALHVPFLVNRAKALDLFRNTSRLLMFRSYYGNFYEIECRYMKDCKVYDLETIPDTPYISTTDVSFQKGKVGIFLRKYFNEPCDYEKTKEQLLREQTKELYNEEGEIRYEN